MPLWWQSFVVAKSFHTGQRRWAHQIMRFCKWCDNCQREFSTRLENFFNHETFCKCSFDARNVMTGNFADWQLPIRHLAILSNSTNDAHG